VPRLRVATYVQIEKDVAENAGMQHCPLVPTPRDKNSEG